MNLPVKTIKQLSVLLWFAIFSVPLSAHALECTSDADCAEGEFCEIWEVSSAPCTIDEEGNQDCEEVEEEEEVIGLCQEQAIECEQDSDCPSHLSCEFVSDGIEPTEGQSSGSSGFAGGAEDAAASPEGEDPLPPEDTTDSDIDDTEAEPVDPEMRPEPVEEESGMCIFILEYCEDDNDCAMNFHCETSTVEVGCAVPVIECPEGEDCPEESVGCEDEEFTESYCIPNEIECDSDAACPADWRCQELSESDCDTDDIAIGAPEPNTEEVPEGEARRLPLQEECIETTRSLCIPVGLEAPSQSYDGSDESEIIETNNGETDDGIASGNSVNGDEEESGSETAEAADSTNNDVEEGGCSASPSSPTPWALFGLFALLGMRRRFA